MRKYEINLTESAQHSYRKILEYFMLQDIEYALSFKIEFTLKLSSLATMPERGIFMKFWCRGLLFSGFYIIYKIYEKSGVIFIVDIIDPRQHSKASDYLHL